MLIGGRSSRFGSDKALYTVNGRAMALHVAERTEWSGQYRDAGRRSWEVRSAWATRGPGSVSGGRAIGGNRYGACEREQSLDSRRRM